MPNSALEGHISPFQALLGEAPDISHMQPFGTVCYVLRLPRHQQEAGKLSQVSDKGILVGYSQDSKAYRVLMDIGKVVESRDVSFLPTTHQVPTAVGTSQSMTDFDVWGAGDFKVVTPPPAPPTPPPQQLQQEEPDVPDEQTEVKAIGGFDRYKARIVVKGYAQRAGIDFDDTWAPISKLESVRSFLATAATRNWTVHQVDVKTAFLNAELTEEIYIRLPEEVDGGNQVYRLRKALYGLKQASRAWYEKLTVMMTSFGWTASDADPAFFWRETATAGYEGVCCHVDDMLIGSTVLANVIELKQQLGNMVEIKDLGVASYYLAMEVQQRSDKLLLTQQKYISEILERFQVPQFEKKHTPMDTRQLSAEDGDLLDDQSTAKYREMTGCLISLMYVCRGTRPDIAYSVGVLARYMKQPRTLHLKAAMDILKYLAATKLMGIEYGGQRDTFVGYSDSDLGVVVIYPLLSITYFQFIQILNITNIFNNIRVFF
ncbi:hypothetical protein CEUSTIGMA_g5178.t1 [Chlamydomonas eustigma]|uniref:Uncharacterized protein n=1 Tax=Chlamydomonas eustigma TaxID=1157962 RepID=A0A250X3T7_9CHLO|nr:hypothetical protein CEUSTIGMA_g5178.t1 [Chlamydomonas eustigma]|eukprot:GAX77735.1 hypothetical protein CEUSTIGMA_g5178.t1 [Chlamydomonas eustigma]